jgi:hypothetical protein
LRIEFESGGSASGFQRVQLNPDVLTYCLLSHFDIKQWQDRHALCVKCGWMDCCKERFGEFVREIPLKETIEVQTTTQIVYPNLTRNSMLKGFQNHTKAMPFIGERQDADLDPRKCFQPSIAGSIWYGYSFGERCAFARGGRRVKEAAHVCGGLPG